MANKEMKTLTLGNVTYEIVDEKSRRELDTKGMPNGIATLDETGKVPEEQLPELGKKYDVGGDDLGLVKNGGNVVIGEDGTMTTKSYESEGDNSFATNESAVAIAPYSDASGYNNQAGCKAFAITEIDKTARTYTLDSVEGLEVGDVYSARVCYDDGTSSWCDEYGKITSINGNVVTVDNIFCERNFEAKDSYVTDYGIDIGQNVFIISSKPMIGTRIIGHSSHAEGYHTVAVGKHSHAEGDANLALGNNSHAEGNYTTASGGNSHAEGFRTVASGDYSHAEGYQTKSSGERSHAEGNYTTASGKSSHAEGGSNTKAEGQSSHAEGGSTRAIGDYSHTEGNSTTASGNQSHAEGYQTNTIGVNSHAEGYYTKSEGIASHSEGSETKAIADYSHAEGYKTKADGINAHSEGNSTTASGESSHSEGNQTKAKGIASHAEGTLTQANGDYSHAEGRSAKANGAQSHAEGTLTTADGTHSHVEGYRTDSIGESSHAEGSYTTASGTASHAEGGSTNAGGNYSHAEGNQTTSDGVRSHAEGYQTKSSGYISHAEGIATVSGSAYQHVQGKYNIEDTTNTYANIVGNGSKEDDIDDAGNITKQNRSNAHTLDWQGNAWYQGSVTSNGADYAEFFEWLDGNSDNEDRVGLLVSLDGEKIKLANNGDEILGIISGTAAVLGDNYECEWNGKYLTDDFGRVVYDMVEEFTDEVVGEDEEGNPIIEKQSLGFFKHPRLNPAYDPEKAYVNRSDRPEWDTVGMLGKLHVRDDGTCQVNGYATVGEKGIATASLEKTNMRVLSRVNENVVRVLLK